MFLSILFLITTIICSMGYTQPQQETQSENSCSCCQGIAGIIGIPGSAGNPGLPGLPGRDGMKGESGEVGISIIGEKGETGHGQRGLIRPEGPAAEKGEQGLQGLPGETGPRGQPGQPASIGLTGQKGESGRTRQSAFTAIKTASQTGNIGDVVTFQMVPTNVNNHFSIQSNKFTCHVSGTYVFMFAVGVYDNEYPATYLVKNGDLVVCAYSRTGGSYDFDLSTNAAILDLEAGDAVWLEFAVYSGRTIYSNTHRHTSFSGFLLYEH